MRESECEAAEVYIVVFDTLTRRRSGKTKCEHGDRSGATCPERSGRRSEPVTVVVLRHQTPQATFRRMMSLGLELVRPSHALYLTAGSLRSALRDA